MISQTTFSQKLGRLINGSKKKLQILLPEKGGSTYRQGRLTGEDIRYVVDSLYLLMYTFLQGLVQI